MEEQNKVQWFTPTDSTKQTIIIKTYNGNYVTLGERGLLTANQKDSTKAEQFQKIKLPSGKFLLKASTGKYVCVEQSENNYLFANRDYGGEWETFEMSYLDSVRINIKSAIGKFVCYDLGIGDKLIGNRDSAKEWETFQITLTTDAISR